MFGPDLNVKGGISSVIKQYISEGIEKEISLIFIPTTVDGSPLVKIIFFMGSIGKSLLYLLKYKPDICHIHVSQRGSFYRKCIIALLCKIYGRVIIPHIHGSQFADFITKNSINRFLARFLLRQSKVVIVLHNEFKQFIQGFDSKVKTEVLYNPIEVPSATDTSSRDNLNILFLGRLSDRKGTFDLLEVINQERDFFTHSKALFSFCGDGELDRANDFVDNHDLHEVVRIIGWIDGTEKTEYLSSSAIYILPSYNEQMPMSILEAMSHKLPVISTHVAGIPEMVIDQHNGILVKPGDTQALSMALTDLINDKDKRIQMGNNGFNLVLKTFQSKIIVKGLVELYRRCLSTNPP